MTLLTLSDVTSNHSTYCVTATARGALPKEHCPGSTALPRIAYAAVIEAQSYFRP